MTQTAHNDLINLPADDWVEISEINCTFVVESGHVEIIGMDDSAPTADQRGVFYAIGAGEDSATNTLGRFPGSGTANRIYARSSGEAGAIFVSRAAV